VLNTLAIVTGEDGVTTSDTAEDGGVPKLRAGLRYLKEQLITGGVRVLPSEECLYDFVLNAIEAAALAQEPGESYVACLRRQLEGRARFILEWMGSDQAINRAVGRELIRLARKHGLRRGTSSARAPSNR
jgi:hypothetical protein